MQASLFLTMSRAKERGEGGGGEEDARRRTGTEQTPNEFRGTYSCEKASQTAENQKQDPEKQRRGGPFQVVRTIKRANR